MAQHTRFSSSTSDSRRLWRTLTRMLAGLLLAWGSLLFTAKWRATLPLPPLETNLYAYLPDNGGWKGDSLRVESGRDIHLVLRSVEGTHALRIAHTDVESTLLTPNSEQVLIFTAPAPGRYVVECTVWCGPNHWRMRTVLEVTDPAAPDAPINYVQDTPRYEIPWTQLNIDAAHPADSWPIVPADPVIGAEIWKTLDAEIEPSQLIDAYGWPLATPADVYIALQAGQGLPAAANMNEVERWALVAFLWEAKSTPTVLERGADLFTRNCASCHGVDGSGTGFAAAVSPALEPDFRHSPTAAGASPLQLYAKIARGGMGTGMPNWGTVLDEDDLWSVTEYLYTFLFRDPHTNGETTLTHE
ncbi:MAG: c-type cytochrome [Caldilineaceae bacterium]|nr:c-type cytochrome [Caldilineaceae bacterium]